MKKVFANKKLMAAIALGAIVIVGIWVRTYNYHDWLFFKWDQAREAILLSPAIENGAENLPLLGPRATKVGEDYLRLGPMFYYFMYLSGIIFDSIEPDVFAYPDLFFSILAIPLLYLFARLYFSRIHSVLITLLYAFSFLVIQYSRFAWNPNSVPFFELLSFYGLLRFVNSKKFKAKLGWIALWASSFAIATQLHYFAFLSIAAITGVFVFFRYELWKMRELGTILRPLFSKQGAALVLLAVFVIGIFYSPVIISDAMTGGSNTKNFIGAFSEKPRQDKTTWQKIVRNLREQPKYYYLLITSFRHRKGMKADPIPVGLGTAFVVFGLALSVYLLREERERMKRDFIALTIIWTVLFFLITIPTSYQLRPRFFVVVFAIPYIFFGLWFVVFEKYFKKRAWPITASIVIAVLLLNAYGTRAWFREQDISQKRGAEVGRTYILQRQDGITLGQLERGADYVYQNRRGDSIVFFSDAEYTNPIAYLLGLKKDPALSWKIVKSVEDLRGEDFIFAFNNTKGGLDSLSKKVRVYGKVFKTIEFGQLTVYEMDIDQTILPKLEPELEKEQETPDEDADDVPEEEYGKTERLFWRDVFK